MPQKNEDTTSLPDITAVLHETEKIIRQCFTQFQIDEVFLSFNGGKDCTVLLDVTIRVLQSMYNREDIGKDLKVLYLRSNDSFEEIDKFVKQIESHYGVSLIVTEGEMRETLQRILDKDNRLKACLMGTRRTDPYSENLKFMQKTDSGWPQMLRVSPLLNWSYHQIWRYILERKVPYCKLYDKGYTSIGSKTNTRPNPSLAYTNKDGEISYQPAWLLTDGALERAGRGIKQALNGHNLDKAIECYNSDMNSDRL